MIAELLILQQLLDDNMVTPANNSTTSSTADKVKEYTDRIRDYLRR
tara:strand:- start:759 stop:896 length:138 start_codon:yes stop_codon:yes gene_type:complete